MRSEEKNRSQEKETGDQTRFVNELGAQGRFTPQFWICLRITCTWTAHILQRIPNIVYQYKIPKSKSSELIPSFMKRYPVLHTEQVYTQKQGIKKKKRGVKTRVQTWGDFREISLLS